ncbi:MAG: 4-hydroxythreonine-4-phosphate dehydrogenase PdxA [Saprospiraceae bacterium]|nr:4-hydroxythreonine-4-phosphate dehydrogenase PdxA [Saprospiraceae bacterium]
MDKIRIGISCGDINSISLEVILKALSKDVILESMIPVIYGNIKIVSYHRNIVHLDNISLYVLNPGERPKPGKINIINSWNDQVTLNLGKASVEGGKYAMMALDNALEDLKNQQIDALVTGPVHKHSMKLAGFEYKGHTDYLAEKMGAKNHMMMMISDKIRMGLVTDHIPLKDVAAKITKETLLKKIQMMEQTLVRDFGIEKPNIAVLGLNPHAGEEGMLGNEEEEIIRPAIIESKKSGVFVAGPYPADGFFGTNQFTKFDGILAMYHDQGLIPFKSFNFYSGVNYTAGLPFIRTSPDHGTAFELAGKNEADFRSMFHAIIEAKNIVATRKGYHVMRENPLKKKPKISEEISNN